MESIQLYGIAVATDNLPSQCAIYHMVATQSVKKTSTYGRVMKHRHQHSHTRELPTVQQSLSRSSP